MPRKSPRPSNPAEKQVITMPETNSMPLKKKNSSPVSTISTNSAPDLEATIRQRAYELYEQRGYTPGFDREDWFKAEGEVLGRNGKRQQSA
ncbi:MAG: DUF2934 domain-containing protein [Terriglobales bacterium]